MNGIKIYPALIAVLAITLGGCLPQDQVSSSGSKKTNFEDYLEFKRIRVRDDVHRKLLREQFMEREALANMIEKEQLLDQNLTRAELNEFRKEMLISRYFEKFLQQKITDEAVRNYYAANAGKYEDHKVHVAHILVRTDRNMGETERKAKLTSAQEAYSRIKAGADFAEVAKQYSEDAISAKKGGDLGWLKEGSIDARFSKTAFSMKLDQISEPFESAFGFHIVKLLESPVVVKKPLKAVSGDIRYQLRNQAKDAELKRLVGSGA